MNILDAIRTRRSIGKVTQEPVDRAFVETILEAATWAPSHGRTEPWKFFVMQGDGRKRLGAVLADIAKEKMTEPLTEANEETLGKERAKALRSPVVIAVTCEPANDSAVTVIEDKAAVAAAVQNMLLAAHSLGLGAVWRTGPQAYHPKMNELFEVGPSGTVIGFVYLGHPDMVPPEAKRKAAAERTVWIDSDMSK